MVSLACAILLLSIQIHFDGSGFCCKIFKRIKLAEQNVTFFCTLSFIFQISHHGQIISGSKIYISLSDKIFEK